MDEVSAGFCIKQRGGYGGGGNTGGGTGTKCGRWNPTTEQVKVLTELFRSGLRTPSTDQIQKISSQLSFYGKIESKNVFYWFQNHKARERQKRRRVLVDEHQDHDNRVSSTKYVAEINQVPEPERVLETLQLFPLNSFLEPEKRRAYANLGDHHCKKNSSLDYNITGAEMDHPTLDLRLSFL